MTKEEFIDYYNEVRENLSFYLSAPDWVREGSIEFYKACIAYISIVKKYKLDYEEQLVDSHNIIFYIDELAKIVGNEEAKIAVIDIQTKIHQ